MAYYRALLREMEDIFEYLSPRRKVSQIHFGGGTPNYMPVEFLQGLLEKIKTKYTIKKRAEVAIECDPNLISQGDLNALRHIGFNRIN